jgi:hypothetical protein
MKKQPLGGMEGSMFKEGRHFSIPELSLCLSAFFLHFFWEVVHSYFYTMKEADFNTMLYDWLHCTGRDVMLTLGSFWLVSLISWNRRWFLGLNKLNVAGFVMAGVIYTFFSERLNVYVFKSWSYNEAMPIIPWFKVGLTPILQWLIIPPVVIFVVRIISHYPLGVEKI